jgi:hypothetical protein
MAATIVIEDTTIVAVRKLDCSHPNPYKVLIIVEGKRGHLRNINLRISEPVRVNTLKTFLCGHLHLPEDQLNFQYNTDGTYDPEFMLMTEHAPDEVAYFNYFAQRVDPVPAGVATADEPGGKGGGKGSASSAGVATADQPE